MNKKHYLYLSAIMTSLLLSFGCGGSGGGAAPSAPQNVTATGTIESISISWDAVIDATSYNIYYSTSSGVIKETGTKLTDVSNPYAISDFTAGTTYYFAVTSANSNGESALSSEVSGHIGFQGILDTSFKNPAGYANQSITTEEPSRDYLAIDLNGNIYYANFDEGPTGHVIWGVDNDGNNLTNFGNNGVKIYGEACTSREGGIALDTNGNIYEVTQCDNDPDIDMAIHKYNSGGELTGTLTETIPYGGVASIAIDTSNNIFVIGDDGTLDDEKVFVRKFKPTMEIDTSFGDSGVANYSEAPGSGTMDKITFDSDGNIYVSGTREYDDKYYAQLFKFKSNGTLDATFGTGGAITYTEQSASNYIIRGSDGSIYIAGQILEGESAYRMFIDKFDSSGNKVLAFGTNGRYILPYEESLAPAMVMEREGLIVAVVWATISSDTITAMIALNSVTGQLDNSLFTDGIYPFPNFNPYTMAFTIGVDSDGKILIGGITYSEEMVPSTLTLIRFR